MVPEPELSSLEDLVRWRRDVRAFLNDPVPPELLRECLRLATLSPSVGLSQPWRFVELNDPTRRKIVEDSFKRCNAAALDEYRGSTRTHYARLKLEGLREAPIHLAVFSDEATGKGRGLGSRTMPEALRYSVVMCIHTFWLAARQYGLGVGWLSILDPGDINRACDAPDDWRFIAYLCVGWPRDIDEVPELQREGWEDREAWPNFYRKL